MVRTVMLLAVLTSSLSAIGLQAWHHPASHALAASSAPTVAGSPVLENLSSRPRTVEVALTASATRLSLLPGTTSDVYAYNGRVPGPTLEAREGDTVIVHFRNDLPEPTTVHWHGLQIPFVADGSPFHPVAPGEQHDYVFTLNAGSAGTYW